MNYKKIKRIMDCSVSLVAIVLLSPLFAIVGLIIYIDDGAPVVFRQQRSGAGGKLFTIYKFRTMPKDAANIESRNAADLKKTRVGGVLRRLNLDELPQLVNVLKGDMSLVGPRPALPSQTELLEARTRNGSARLAPGLTGLAQVKGFDGMSNQQKAEYDRQYSDNVSFSHDMIIAFKTIGYLTRRPPVY